MIGSLRSATQSILIAPGNVAGVIEQNVLIGFDDHQVGVVQMLGQPIGRNQAVGVGSSPGTSRRDRRRQARQLLLLDLLTLSP